MSEITPKQTEQAIVEAKKSFDSIDKGNISSIRSKIDAFLEEHKIEENLRNATGGKTILNISENLIRKAEELSNLGEDFYEAGVRVAAFLNNFCYNISRDMKKNEAGEFMQKFMAVRDSHFPYVFGHKNNKNLGK